MNTIMCIAVCFLASLGAGLTTSLSGGSGTSILSPVLTCVLGIPAYDAIGIALASDIVASAAAAFTYAKAGNVRIRETIPLLITILLFTLLGSWIASFLPNITLGSMTVFMMIGLGVVFLRNAKKPEQPQRASGNSSMRMFKVILCGVGMGLLCGFLGAGGGIMVMATLHGILKFPFKQAVGTATFVMAFTATIGTVGHFLVGGIPDVLPLLTCTVLTTAFSFAGANLANRADIANLKRLVGAILLVMGVAMFLLFVR